jgi:hypothetical protein
MFPFLATDLKDFHRFKKRTDTESSNPSNLLNLWQNIKKEIYSFTK